MSCGVGGRHGLDLLWLWPAAVAWIRPLAWEPPHAVSTVLKRQKAKKKKKVLVFQKYTLHLEVKGHHVSNLLSSGSENNSNGYLHEIYKANTLITGGIVMK